MRVESPDLGWHGEKDRILSIDFHPFNNQVVTAGSDEKKFTQEQRQGTEGCIKIWQIIDDDPKKLNIKILYGLNQVSDNTNIAKFSPHGALMASGSDDKAVVIWQKRENVKTLHSTDKVYRWSKKMALLGHSSDVLDLAWTRNSKYVVSVGMDARIFIWLLEKRCYLSVLDYHEKFVQGVAVDPVFQHIISCSNDRTSRVWKAVKSKKQLSFFTKRVLKRFNYNKKQEEDMDGMQEKSGFRMFADQNIPTFFRRPDFSPDGQLLLLPAGQWQKQNQTSMQYCAFLYRKNFIDRPVMVIPTKNQPVLVCKFCPILFKKSKTDDGIFQQPYYMVFAIATSGSVLIYNTLSASPIYGMGNYHYATITSLSWKNSNILGISSSDGYCSFMIFQKNQLGEEYQAQGQLAQIMKVEAQAQKKQKAQTSVPQQQKVQMKQVAGGGVKKTITPKIIQRF